MNPREKFPFMSLDSERKAKQLDVVKRNKSALNNIFKDYFTDLKKNNEIFLFSFHFIRIH